MKTEPINLAKQKKSQNWSLKEICAMQLNTNIARWSIVNLWGEGESCVHTFFNFNGYFQHNMYFSSGCLLHSWENQNAYLVGCIHIIYLLLCWRSKGCSEEHIPPGYIFNAISIQFCLGYLSSYMKELACTQEQRKLMTFYKLYTKSWVSFCTCLSPIKEVQ